MKLLSVTSVTAALSPLQTPCASFSSCSAHGGHSVPVIGQSTSKAAAISPASSGGCCTYGRVVGSFQGVSDVVDGGQAILLAGRPRRAAGVAGVRATGEDCHHSHGLGVVGRRRRLHTRIFGSTVAPVGSCSGRRRRILRLRVTRRASGWGFRRPLAAAVG